MDRTGSILLAIGATILVFSVVVAIVMRRRHAAEQEVPAHPAGLIPDELRDSPPDGLTPGMVGALLNDQTGSRDVMITLVDLARRGFIRLTPLGGADDAPAHDWVLATQSAAETAEGLHVFEYSLLTALKDAADDSGQGSVTLSSMVTAPGQALIKARRQIHDDTLGRGWFHRDPLDHHTRWGWLGGCVLIVGLISSVMSVINVITTNRWGSVIGPVMIIIAGLLLASLGRLRSQRTPEGSSARHEALAYKRYLDQLHPEKLTLDQVPGIFSDGLPYALVFGNADDLAVTIGGVVERAERWGATVDLGLEWFNSPASTRPLSEFVEAISHFVDSGARLIDERGGEL